MIVGFVIFLPNLIWQYTEKFPVVYHMNELHRTQLQYVKPSAIFDRSIADEFTVCFYLAGRLMVCQLFCRREKIIVLSGGLTFL
jgi:hypothetical protein